MEKIQAPNGKLLIKGTYYVKTILGNPIVKYEGFFVISATNGKVMLVDEDDFVVFIGSEQHFCIHVVA